MQRLWHGVVPARLHLFDRNRRSSPWTLLDCTPVRFRLVWSRARRRLKIPARFTVYGLRRGGATGLFRRTGSFDQVCDRGRWGSVVACRIYVTTALQDAAMQEFAAHNSLWERWAAKLWRLPA